MVHVALTLDVVVTEDYRWPGRLERLKNHGLTLGPCLCQIGVWVLILVLLCRCSTVWLTLYASHGSHRYRLVEAFDLLHLRSIHLVVPLFDLVEQLVVLDFVLLTF